MDQDSFKEYIVQVEPSKRDKGYAWHTAIGLQAVDALTPSQYLLNTAVQNIEGEITLKEAQELLERYYEEDPERSTDYRTEEADKVSLRIAMLLSENALHNRSMHIRGIFQEHQKPDIQHQKPDIEVLAIYQNKLDQFTNKTIKHTQKLFFHFGKDQVFGRTNAISILGLSPSRTSELLGTLLEAGVIEPVSGYGKGKYKFAEK